MSQSTSFQSCGEIFGVCTNTLQCSKEAVQITNLSEQSYLEHQMWHLVCIVESVLDKSRVT